MRRSIQLLLIPLLLLGAAAALAQYAEQGGQQDPFADPRAEQDPFGPGNPSRAPRDGYRSIQATPSERTDRDVFVSTKETPIRIWASPGEKANEPIRKALARPLTSVGLDFTDSPLEEFVYFLHEEYDIEVQIDLPALDDLGIGPDDPVDCNLRRVTLGAALRVVLGQMELTAVPADGMLLVTTEEEASTMFKTAVYPVGNLGPMLSTPRMTALQAGGRSGFGRQESKSAAFTPPLVKTIVSCIAAETWRENGGGEAELSMLPGGVLVVTQTELVHSQIVALLDGLRSVPQPTAVFAPAPPTGQFFPSPVNPMPPQAPTVPSHQQFDFGTQASPASEGSYQAQPVPSNRTRTTRER